MANNQLAIQRRIRESRRVSGVCIACGRRPADTGSLCIPCKEYRRERNLSIRIDGQCFRCAKPNANGKKLCDKCLAAKKAHNAKYKQMVIEAYGGRCACCGEDNPVFLSIDHIDNKGNKHRLTGVGCGNKLYQWLVRNDFPKDNYQLLCFNCNQGKRVNGGVCPHQQETDGIMGCVGGQLRLVEDL